jgi:hypothetical protein
MPFANGLDYLFKHFVHYSADTMLEGFEFLWCRLVLNGADGIIHLVVDAQEHLEIVFRGVWIIKQGSAPWGGCVDSPGIITQGPDQRAYRQSRFRHPRHSHIFRLSPFSGKSFASPKERRKMLSSDHRERQQFLIRSSK